MTSWEFNHLEETLKTLSDKGDLSFSRKQAIRDRVFRAIGQIELADAIVEGEAKAASLDVSLSHLRRALLPHRLSFSMPITIAVMVLVFVASVMTGAVAQSSTPTSSLFPVKKVLEQIELAFIRNPLSRATATLNIADERLKHLEASLGEEAALSTVLRESQVALVSARDALEKAQEGNEADPGVAALLERFNALLSDQKTILQDIEGSSENEEVKNAVVAIREALKDGAADIKTTGTLPSGNASSSATPSNQTANQGSVSLPEGVQTFTARIGTVAGKPAIFVGDRYYQVALSPIDLTPYIGRSGVMITGEISGTVVKIYRIAIDSTAWGEKPPAGAN
ncbi:hypothetical protein A2V68_00185 [candidate division Kazan bacterium RBG_13_50_9]|uniref:DUF5667 domain-containing protein n=1 Tax=candidate division Kazan bacterium RBG_13_50_9 TaxID=1798535 RepID=A0A1F4NSD2_UNCK3|nr:MAG: hypothetical protein A2V68_00185 [candidate division Kazan bacterium RBG_13_50_9]